MKSGRKPATIRPVSKEVYQEARQNVEISYSMDDQPRRNISEILQDSNMFIFKARAGQDMFEEDKKDCSRSHNSAIL